MAQLALKYCLFMFEIISIFALIIIYSRLIYSIGKLGFQNLSGSNQIYMSFEYKAEKLQKYPEKHNGIYFLNLILRNIEFNSNIDKIDPEKATMIINNNFYNKYLSKLSGDEVWEEFNRTVDVKRCFIFNKKYVHQGRAFLLYMERYSKDFFNISTFIFLFIFCLFLKTHLCKQHFDYIKKIEFLDYNAFKDTLATPILNKSCFFHYVIFYFSLIFAIPTLYYLYFNYSFDNCFSFQNDSFESFAYDRKFVIDLDTLNIIISDEKDNIEKDNILRDMLYYDKYNILPTKKSLNNWLIILYICSLIWSCRYYDLFSIETNVSSNVLKTKLIFVDKIIFSISITIITGFIIIGLMNYIDDIQIFILYLFYDINFVRKLGNLFYILGFIIHISLYTIIIIYSLKNKIVLLYRNENRVFPMNKKRSQIIDFPNNSLNNEIKLLKTEFNDINDKGKMVDVSIKKSNYNQISDVYESNYIKNDSFSMSKEGNSNSFSESGAINNSIIKDNE